MQNLRFCRPQPTRKKTEVFAIPVDELADAMNIPRGQAVQVVKSCYGLVNAPHRWFLEIRETIINLGGETLVTEPCCWRIRDPDNKTSLI